jgi:hypothetical protein
MERARRSIFLEHQHRAGAVVHEAGEAIKPFAAIVFKGIRLSSFTPRKVTRPVQWCEVLNHTLVSVLAAMALFG